MDNVKNELFANYSTVSFCHACLSTDRALSTVNEFVDILQKIVDNQQNLVLPNTLLCWECVTLLKKVRMFTKKAADAQRMLQFCYLNIQDPFPHSLSTLTNSPTNTDITTITYEEKELKPIKLENEFEDQFETFENFEFTTDYIKEEPDPKLDDSLGSKIDTDVKTVENLYRKSKEYNDKRNLKRAAKYRFINTKIRKHRDLLVRKIPIGVNEALDSLEEERCNDSFVKAEYKCESCVEIFDDAEKVAKHNNKYHDESLGLFVCRICHSRWPTAAALRGHSARHTRRECRACGHACCAGGGMRRHVAVHHRIVQCLACELFFNNVRLFYNHYKAMHSRYVCDVCGKRCKTRQIIEKHLRYHFGYECPYCKKKLKNSSSYNNHIECQHGDSCAETAYCVPCDRRFKNDKLYKRHLQASAAHARERDNTRTKRKYPCPECSNVYSRRTYMNNHYRHVHSKQSKHYCEDCDRHFLNRTRYVDHRRYKHEGAQRDKDKLCNICGRGFAANRTLVNHLRTHSGERPFACEYCGAKFTQKHAMLSHVQYIHLKSKRKPSWRD